MRRTLLSRKKVLTHERQRSACIIEMCRTYHLTVGLVLSGASICPCVLRLEVVAVVDKPILHGLLWWFLASMPCALLAVYVCSWYIGLWYMLLQTHSMSNSSSPNIWVHNYREFRRMSGKGDVHGSCLFAEQNLYSRSGGNMLLVYTKGEAAQALRISIEMS